MDELIIEKKVDSIIRFLNRIHERIPDSEDEFLKDYDAQDVVILNLTRAVQLCVDIATHVLSTTNQPVPSTMAEAFISLERVTIISAEIADKMKRSVGFRNVAVHNYDDIDLSITYEIADKHLRNVHEITSTTSLSFYPSSALQKQLRSLLCAYFFALNTNKNPTPVVELIPCTFLSDFKEFIKQILDYKVS